MISMCWVLSLVLLERRAGVRCDFSSANFLKSFDFLLWSTALFAPGFVLNDSSVDQTLKWPGKIRECFLEKAIYLGRVLMKMSYLNAV